MQWPSKLILKVYFNCEIRLFESGLSAFTEKKYEGLEQICVEVLLLVSIPTSCPLSLLRVQYGAGLVT